VEVLVVRRRTLNSHIKKENKKIDKFLSDLFKLYKKHGLSIVQKSKKDPFIVTTWSKENEDWMKEAVDGIIIEKPKEDE
jgi:hypothetical protein